MPELQKLVSIKNKFLFDFIQKRDQTIKAELHLNHENHRNVLSTPLKNSVNKVTIKNILSLI